MKAYTPLSLLLAASIRCVTASSTLPPQTINVKAWPFSSSTAVSFATISYDPSTSMASIQDVTPYSPSTSDPTDFVRLGFHKGTDVDESTWTGVAIPPSSLDQHKIKTIRIHVDDKGNVQALSLASRDPVPQSKKAVSNADKKKQKKKSAKGAVTTGGDDVPRLQDNAGLVRVEVVKSIPGPMPVLNKPIVVNKDGQVEETVPEKSFLQKYWWAIGLFLLVQVVMGSSGEEKK